MLSCLVFAFGTIENLQKKKQSENKKDPVVM